MPSEGVTGYAGILPPLYGSLSVTKLKVAGVEYTVGRVMYDRSGLADTLVFNLSPAFSGPFTLHTGSVATASAS